MAFRAFHFFYPFRSEQGIVSIRPYRYKISERKKEKIVKCISTWKTSLKMPWTIRLRSKREMNCPKCNGFVTTKIIIADTLIALWCFPPETVKCSHAYSPSIKSSYSIIRLTFARSFNPVIVFQFRFVIWKLGIRGLCPQSFCSHQVNPLWASPRIVA